MKYFVKAFENTVDWNAVPVAEIASYAWDGKYQPRATAQLAMIRDSGFYLRMTAFERNPRAIYMNYNDPVYKDSCLELFVSFNAASPYYMNFEMNSNGAFLSAVRQNRKEKTPIHELVKLPEVRATVSGDFWTIETFFSFEFIKTLFGDIDFRSGYVFRGNFYKCGDETETPHYGSWSPIENPVPDFHLPEFFGEFEII